jgi:hydrogenase maturation factor
MKINIKRVTNESTQIVNGKTHRLARNSEPIVIATLIGDLKRVCKTTQTRLENQGNRLLIELEKISSESCQKVETP